jgi:uncharacterized protein (DUF1697 family)
VPVFSLPWIALVTSITRSPVPTRAGLPASPRRAVSPGASLPRMPRQIALLRAVNLGPVNRVKMADLRALLEREGYEDVQTLFQSGNVVLTSAKRPDTVAREMERLLADELGVDTAVVVRTRDELAGVIERNPIAEADEQPKRCQVSFLAEEPDAPAVKRMAELDVAPERFAVSGREVYAWHPDGLQRSKLARALGEGLGVTATARNWNTVTKLLELADSAS